MNIYHSTQAIEQYTVNIQVYYDVRFSIDEPQHGMSVTISEPLVITVLDENDEEVNDSGTIEYLRSEISISELISEINDNL